MRLKAEEISLDKTKLGETAITNLKKKAETSQEGKREVLQAYFSCLQNLSDISQNQTLSGKEGLETLKSIQPPETYLGLTGLGFPFNCQRIPTPISKTAAKFLPKFKTINSAD